jgi:hypothetical protein
VTFQSVSRRDTEYRLHEFVCEDIENDKDYDNTGIRMNLFYDLLISEPPLDSWFICRMRVLWWTQKPFPRRSDAKTEWDVLTRAGAQSDVLLYYRIVSRPRPRQDPWYFWITSLPAEEFNELVRQNGGQFPKGPQDPFVQEIETRKSISYPYRDWNSDTMGYGSRYLGGQEVETGRYTWPDCEAEPVEDSYLTSYSSLYSNR